MRYIEEVAIYSGLVDNKAVFNNSSATGASQVKNSAGVCVPNLMFIDAALSNCFSCKIQLCPPCPSSLTVA